MYLLFFNPPLIAIGLHFKKKAAIKHFMCEQTDIYRILVESLV